MTERQRPVPRPLILKDKPERPEYEDLITFHNLSNRIIIVGLNDLLCPEIHGKY